VPADRSAAPVAQALRTRLLDQASRYRTSLPDSAVQIVDIWRAVRDDVVSMQDGWRMTGLDVQSPRRVAGRPIGGARRVLQRALHPLLARQTDFNLAVNRIVTHLLRVNDRQSGVIARLEDEIEDLRVQLRRRE
jgi:hypothetical protein